MRNARLTPLYAALVLTACHGDSGQSSARKAAARGNAPVFAKKGPTANELTVGMVGAVSQGKSQVPVELKFDLLQRPAIGKALEIAVALIPQISASQATVHVTGSDGLNIAADSREIDLQSVEAAQVYRSSIHVTPSAEGVFFLTFTVTLNHDEITESRTFSTPIIVGAVPGVAAHK